jgi:hypothetical protein
MEATDTITVVEGYEAVRIFLETVWRRLGRPNEEIAFLIAGMARADGAPVDPAMWQDWLAAVEAAAASVRHAEV